MSSASFPAGLPTPDSAYLLTIGDIGITPDHFVVTPSGSAPLRGTHWVAIDQSYTRSEIPTYAIVLAVVFALMCLLGLLFLLVREDVTMGYVQISVTGAGLQHTTQVPVNSMMAVAQVRAQVAQAQSLAAAA